MTAFGSNSSVGSSPQASKEYSEIKSQDAIGYPGQPRVPRKQIYLTFSIFMSFMAFGMVDGMLGPTFVHLSYLFDTDIKTLSYTHLFGNFGYVLGSFFCGVISSRFSYQLQVAIATVCMGIVVLICPWMPSVYFYFGADILRNICMAYLDTVSVTYLVLLWDGHRLKEPLTQGLHGLWAAGATMCPFIIIPFLSELPEDPIDNEDLQNATLTTGAPNDTTFGKLTDLIDDDDIERIRYAFVLIGGLSIVLSTFAFVGYCLYPQFKPEKKRTQNEEESDGKIDSKAFKIIMLILQFLFYYLAIWCSFIIANFISTFVIKSLKWNAKYGSIMASVYRISQWLGKIAAIPMSYFISPGKMVFVDLIFASFACVLLLFIPIVSENIIWIGTALAGFSLSSMLPYMFLWVSSCIQMTGSIAALQIVAASFGMMTAGPLAGYVFQEYSHIWLIYLCLISSVSGIIISIVMALTIRCFHKNQKEHQPALASEMEPMKNQID